MQIKSLSFLTAALLFSGIAQADWSLDGADSTLHYVTTKAAAISELNSFSSLSGAIDASGATLVIDLASVNTAIEIRDQRMRDIVFQTGTHPTATATVPVDAATLDAMAVGTLATSTHTVTFDLHGISQAMEANLQVLKLDTDTLVVNLATPLIVNAAAFGLAESVEELREIAGLPSIVPAIVVDFSLVYRRD